MLCACIIHRAELNFSAPVSSFDYSLSFIQDQQREVALFNTPVQLVDTMFSGLIVELAFPFPTKQERCCLVHVQGSEHPDELL